MQQRNKKERGVIYARYSTGSHQTEQSIEGQVRECKDYARTHGIEIIGEYIDRRISGTTDNRENFLQMIADSKHHKFDVVVTYKTDRFSRNRYDAAVYKRALQKNGVRIAYAKESIPDGPEGIILESLLEGLAEYYSAELRQKIERGMIESAHKGKALGPMLVGYRKAEDGRYAIDEKMAPAIRMIFDKYCAGVPAREIAQLAYSMGLRTRSGGVISEQRVTSIVSNQKYIGIYEAYGVRLENGIPPIIDKDTFYLAQKRLEYYKHHRGEAGGRGTAKEDYLLSGKVFCGHCGEPMVGYSAYGRSTMYHYYACRGRVHHRCNKKTIEKTRLEKTVAQITRQKVLEPKVMSAIIDGYMQLQENKKANSAKRQQIKKAIKQTEKAIDNIVTAIADGLASESLKQRLIDLEHQKTQLSIEYSEVRERPKITRQQIQFLFSQAQRKDDESEEEYRKRLIDIFVDSVRLYDDKIVVTYNLQSNSSSPIFSETELSELEPILVQRSRVINGSLALKMRPSKREHL